MQPKFYIVIPVFNRKLWTERCLTCLRAQTFKNFEIIVVDDGSTDGTAELITNVFTEVMLLRGDGNLWWTGAVNLGLQYVLDRACRNDAVLVLNDDTEVYPDYLEALYRLWRVMPRTLIGSILVDLERPELIYNGGNVVNWWTAKFGVLNSGVQLAKFTKDHWVNVSFLTGRGTLIPVQVFREIGLYDDRHFQQCGDTELPVRAKKAGYRLVVSYSAIVKTPIAGSDNINTSDKYSFKDAKTYFFGVRSNYRISYRLFFGLAAARNPFQLITFVAFDLLRITSHFLLRLDPIGK
jgi:N-acetylglucosaminyl-diphospho-decaprenol L-rhamnosyltransferase